MKKEVNAFMPMSKGFLFKKVFYEVILRDMRKTRGYYIGNNIFWSICIMETGIDTAEIVQFRSISRPQFVEKFEKGNIEPITYKNGSRSNEQVEIVPVSLQYGIDWSGLS